MSSAFGNYALWMLFPINIHPTLPDDPSLISYSLFEPRVIVSVSLIIILLGIALKIRKRLTLFFFAILWFFITLIPVSGVFFNLTNYAASRYLYLPIAGFCLLIAGLILELPNFKIFSIQPAILKKTARSIILISVLTYSIFTVIRNMGWRNNIVFGLEIAEIYPNNAVAHSWLGNIFLKNGFFDKALYEYKIALSLNPNYAGDENNLGLCYYKKGLLDEAIAQFKKTIELDPNFLQAYINLGSALGDKGLYQEAMNGTLKDKGLYQEAMDCFNQVLKIDPQNIQAYNALGVTFARIKEWAKARKSWEMAIKIYPKNKEAQENLEKLKQLGY
jgi:tetratricopeptide (TPR) repeat protein